MPNTRKKVIKTIYKDDEDSEVETGDFSDSGSEAKISEISSSEEEEVEYCESSGNEFDEKTKSRRKKSAATKKSRKPKFAKSIVNKINKQTAVCTESDNIDVTPALFSVKNLTDADKLLPSILNLSESDSSDDENLKATAKENKTEITNTENDSYSDNEEVEYKDVWSKNARDDSEEIAKKAFMALEQHKTNIEETKASVQSYESNSRNKKESDVKDLLALGEEVIEPPLTKVKKKKLKKIKDDSDSELEDWEEVKESKTIPQQGIQLFVEFPDAACKKTKKIDVEMMMKRKINRVKKEYQVYMHKVHVLCWLGHGNFISRVLNDQEIMAAALSLVPSKVCYPGERVDMKYVEQITTWYKDKLTLELDKNEDKFRPKARPLKEILLTQIKNRKVSSKKYLVFVFVSMLRALGLQCRVMFNFVTLPLKPPSSELCSLSTKPKDIKSEDKSKSDKQVEKKTKKSSIKAKSKVSQLDGNNDSDCDYIMQVDGNNDAPTVKTRRAKVKSKNVKENTSIFEDEGVSPPKRSRKSPNKVSSASNPVKLEAKSNKKENMESSPKLSLRRQRKPLDKDTLVLPSDETIEKQPNTKNPSRTRSNKYTVVKDPANNKDTENKSNPKIVITDPNKKRIPSKYFEDEKLTGENNKLGITRKRSRTANSNRLEQTGDEQKNSKAKPRTRSAPGNDGEKSQYFGGSDNDDPKKPKLNMRKKKTTEDSKDDNLRMSHRDLVKSKAKPKDDVKKDLVDIMKNRIKQAKVDSKKGIVKGKIKEEPNEDSDYLPEEEPLRGKSESDEDFKPPLKLSPRPSTSKKIDRRVLSLDDETLKNKIDVWCEIFVEELEQWISVDVIRGKIHATKDNYAHATHPVCYVVGWDNNNYLKDLTRRYVPQWNTVTRKLRAEPDWWRNSIQPWLGPKTARDKEEDESLDRMQLEAPLPKSITEYKNHPLYALKRHLLKFEAIYPPDASTLGFVRGEAVYARECVYTCRSRDTWLKEAKVVRLAQSPYKVVKARPKWDKLSNKLITDKPLEVFGPWQVQDYEPPVAENGIVPRNAYGNVELFKDCMLPKGTVHIKLPGLNKVAKKLNIDCAPAMTGFDFNGGWSHPVYDGFVVCKEFEEIITEAWVTDQEEQERKEIEKAEARVYGNWRRLIKGLLIRERLKNKYGFEKPSTSQQNNKSKGPRLVVKKKM